MLLNLVQPPLTQGPQQLDLHFYQLTIFQMMDSLTKLPMLVHLVEICGLEVVLLDSRLPAEIS